MYSNVRYNLSNGTDQFIKVESTVDYAYLQSTHDHNLTCHDITESAGIMAASVLVVIITASFGNTIVVIVICRHRWLRTATNLFIINLAITDILIAILKLPFYIVAFLWNCWPLGQSLCNIAAILNGLFYIQSTYTIMFIAIIRYIALFHPSKSRYISNKTMITIIIALSWLVCIVLCCTPLMGWGKFVYSRRDYSCQQKWHDHIDFTITSILIGWALPCIIMMACYTKISFGASYYMNNLRAAGFTIDFNQHHNATSTTTTTSTHNYHRGQLNQANTLSRSQLREKIIESKLTRSSFVVCCTFIICYLPYSIVVMIIEPFTGYHFSSFLHFLLLWLKFINSSINPAIYSMFDPLFRKGSRQLFRTIRRSRCCHNTAYPMIGLHSTNRRINPDINIRNGLQAVERSIQAYYH